jgi:hypothetical protein
VLLPVRPPRAEDQALPAFAPPEASPPLALTQLGTPQMSETVERDLITGKTTFTTEEDDGGQRHEAIGLEVRHTKIERFQIVDSDPLSARVEIVHSHSVGRGAWRIGTEATTNLSVTAKEFVIHASLDAYENGRRVASRNWDRRHRRDQV